jgi:hypothetical protein
LVAFRKRTGQSDTMLITSLRRCGIAVAALSLANFSGAATAQTATQNNAPTCTVEQVADAVDSAGAALRDITRVNQPKLDDRIRALSRQNKWSDAEATEKALELLADARTASLDRTANELLSKIDQLGNVPPRTAPDCTRLRDLEAASLELQAAVKTKSDYMIARADALVAGVAAPPAPNASATTGPGTKTVAAPEPKATPSSTPLSGQWSTKTTAAPQPLPAAPTTPPQTVTAGTQTLPPVTVPQNAPATPASTGPLPRDDETFTIDEVVRASSGVFGKVTAGLGSVVEHAFSSIGRPTGYIIGEEGGGAFLAGLRYGKGTLHLRDGQTIPVFWHGPSVGLDFGAQSAKVMFLVYRLRQPDQLFFPYTSLEGAAFLAGGLGLTLMTNGETQLAPIRSGIGLRVGASVGYVRFTRKPTWNPF